MNNWFVRFFSRPIQEQLATSFVFIIPAYNCAKWYKKNLSSVFNQTCTNWRIIYIDDYSTDDTGLLAKDYIRKSGFEHKVTFIQNQQRRHSLCNIYNAVHSCADNEIVAILDGDDWLANRNVLAILNQTYKDPNIWLTYGNYIGEPGRWKSVCKEFSHEEISHNSFRDIDWRSSHLKTFYSWLFKRIKKEDLYFENYFFTITGDLAIMFPLLEMAGSHVKFISEILYTYNIQNPLNDGKSRFELQQQMVSVIRTRPKYKSI